MRRVDGVLLLVAVVWGSSYLAAKSATGVIPVLLVLWLRYALSAVALSAPLLARSGRPSRREARVGVVVGITQLTVLVLETFGVAHTTAGNAGLIISLSIVLTPVLERVVSPRQLPVCFLAAAVLAVGGTTLLMLGDGLHAVRVGDLLVLAAAGARALHVVLLGRLAGPDVRVLPMTMVQTWTGAVLLLPVSASLFGGLTAIPGSTWGVLIYLALGCSVFAFVAQTWAVQRTSASRASLLLGTEPVWALVTGLVLADERLTVLQVLGAALIVGAAYWGQRIERQHRERADHRRPNAAPTPGLTRREAVVAVGADPRADAGMTC